MPPEAAPGRKEAERRFLAQIGAVRESGASGLFLPGNHDWEGGHPGGWQALLREQRFLRENGGDRIRFVPSRGCPGPVVVDPGPRLRLVVLDTQWWLHDGEKPRDPFPACPVASEEDVVAALTQAVEEAGERHVVVLAHHPLSSGGQHGGKFGAREHIFPLTELKPWLAIPLPLVGSLYPLARKAGLGTEQDLASPPYRRMREKLEKALRVRPPILYAAGHEHNLQVLGGSPLEGYRTLVVSGSGIYGRKSPVKKLPATLWASEEAGFFALRVAADGSVSLTALVAGRDGRTTEGFSTTLH